MKSIRVSNQLEIPPPPPPPSCCCRAPHIRNAGCRVHGVSTAGLITNIPIGTHLNTGRRTKRSPVLDEMDLLEGIEL